MEENGPSPPPLPKMKLDCPIQKVPKKFEIFPAPSYKIQEKKTLAPPPQRNICGWGVGGVHTMENKATNTDYQKVVRVGDQK